MGKVIALVARTKHIHLFYQISLISVLLIGVYHVTYLSGGTITAWAQLNLIVILLGAYYWNLGAVVVALVAGLLMGPTMPLDVVRHIAQVPVNYLARVAIYILIGFVAGYLNLTSQQLYLTTIETKSKDQLTGLYNRDKLLESMASLLEDRINFTLVVFKITNLEAIIKYVDHANTKKITTNLIHSLETNLGMLELYATNFGEYAFLLQESNIQSLQENLKWLVASDFSAMLAHKDVYRLFL